MSLPRAVALKVERAHQLAASAAAARSTTLPAAPEGVTPAPSPTPQHAAGADVEALQRQLADTQENLRKANERFDTLRAKYDAEVPRAAADLRKLREELKTAQERTTELEALAARKFESGDISSLTDTERQLMGPDMVAASAKIAREVATSMVDARMKPLTDRVDQFERMSDTAYFLALDDGAPNWEAVNNDPKFLAWLNEVDPTTQRVRMDLIKRAEASRQGNRVVEIFRAFLEKREIGAPTPKVPADDPLSKRVDPPVGGSSTPDPVGDDANKRIWSRAEVAKFYDDKRKGVWRGKEAEARMIEQEIFAASKSGRVRG